MSQAPIPDSSWKGLPPWLFFMLLVIGPPAAFVTFARTLTQNPLLIACIVAGYEVLIFLFRFASKIWQQLEKPLIDHIAGSITLRMQELTSRYHRYYCQLLVFEHQIFDMKGLSTRTAHDLELEQVFVDLRLDPTAPHQIWADPLRLPSHLRQGTHSLWDYLSSPELAHQHLVIVGAPGSGKTTLLKHLALILAQPWNYPRRARLRQTFPVLIFLRDHAQSIANNPDFSLVQAVQDHIQRKWQKTMPAPWLSRSLERGMCLVLLDGLDEVADAMMRRQVAAWVQRQLLVYGRNRFVLTSRPYGYRDNPLDGVSVLQVQSFTLGQVEQFVQNWYLANELKSWGKDDPGMRQRAREGAQDLLGRLRLSPVLLSLAVNPLLLTMIATVHRERASLPGKRVALYSEICEVFLGKRQEARGISQDLSPAQKQKVLQPLAYHLMRKGNREITIHEAQQVIAPHLSLVSTQITPPDFLRLVENMSGLLLEHNPGSYSFAHLTFQEYLAAVHIKEEGLEQILAAQVASSWMHETIRLYCAQADATTLILACLADHPPTIAALTLAFECDEEKLMIQPQAQAQLNTMLETGMEDTNPERRRILAEALLTRRLRRMVHLHGQTYIDTELVTCAEYQLFLDEQYAQAVCCQPDHWLTPSFPSGQGRSSVLGVRYADAQAFCDWLTKRDINLWRYRLPSIDELGTVDEREMPIIHVAATTGYWVEGATVKIQKRPYTHDMIIDRLKVRLENDSSRTSEVAGDLAGEVARNLATASDLARDLAGEIALYASTALNLDRELATTYNLALAGKLGMNRLSASNLATILFDSRKDANAIAMVSDRDGDLTTKLARASHLASNITRDLNQAHSIARNLADSIASDLAQDLAHTGNLVYTHSLAIDSILANARILISAMDHILVHARDRDRDLVGAIIFDLTRAIDLAGEVDGSLAHSLARARSIAFDLARVEKLAPTRTSNQDFARFSNQDLAHASTNEIDLARVWMLARDLARDLACDLVDSCDSANDLDNDTDRARALVDIYDLSQIVHIALDLFTVIQRIYARKALTQEREAIIRRWYVRSTAVTLARSLRRYVHLKTSHNPNPLNNLYLVKRFSLTRSHEYERLELAMKSYIDLALTFTLLEERIEGKILAWESILLVKEPRATTKEV